tara:strand:- start:1617 stop:2729 length:1113 start_codon:yes stop_codon:yes gene_type:complete
LTFSIVVKKLTLNDARTPSGVTIIRPSKTASQIFSSLGMYHHTGTSILGQWALTVYFDGKKIVFHGGHDSQSIFVDNKPEIVGAGLPFKASFTTPRHAYQKHSGPLDVIVTETSFILRSELLPHDCTPSYVGESVIVDYGELFQTDYQFELPYSFLRQQVLKEREKFILATFAPSGIGLYNPQMAPIYIPKKFKTRFYAATETSYVIQISANDLKRCLTRAGAKGKDVVFIGVAKTTLRGREFDGARSIGRRPAIGIKGKSWSGTCLRQATERVFFPMFNVENEPANNVKTFISPQALKPFIQAERFIPHMCRADLNAGDWAKTPDGEEMNEQQKQAVREWYLAFIAQKARLGEDISTEHQEVAEELDVS